MKLRGLSKNAQSSTLITTINEDVLTTARALLDQRGLVIFEEALIRTGPGHRGKNRQWVQWQAIKNELELIFGRSLIRLSRTFLREQTHGDDPPLKMLQDVKEHLKKGYGAETAGYCFPATYEELTRRQILHRRHIAQSFERNAVALERALPSPQDAPALLPC